MTGAHQFFAGGIPRSGNHAVIFWLLSCYPMAGHSFYANDVDADTEVDKCGMACGVISGEGPGMGRIEMLRAAHEKNLSRQAKNVLVLRDPLNHAASYGKKLLRYPSFVRWKTSPALFVSGWKTLAEEFISALEGRSKWFPVCYNIWFASAAYRGRVASSLGLSPAPRLGWIPPFGGGSSFPWARHTAGGVLERYLQEKNVYTDAMRADGGAMELAKTIRDAHRDYEGVWEYR